MAIALGQPVDEITHGLDGIKIGGHVKASEKAGKSEVQDGSLLPSADVLNVQAFPDEGHEHPAGEVALRHPSGFDQSLELPCLDRSQSDFNLDEREFSGAPEFSPFYHGPIYTGYPAPIVNAQGYSSEGVIYQNPVVEYNPVYNQNFYCSAPCTVGQFNYGYGQTYAYPQYQVAPVEQYNIPAPLPEGSFMPYSYQHMNPEAVHGQLVPMAIAGPPPAYSNVPGFHSMPFSPVCTPHVLSAASPPWIQQPMNAKGLNDEPNHVQVKSGFQQYNISVDGNLNITKPGSEKADSRVHMTVAKKHSRKQFGPGPLYGLPVPVKGAWVRAGHLQCTNTSQPLKPFHGKNKAPGVHPLNVEQFNLANFSTEFEDAKHFIIKSFSDENVYRSIQHGVWASTPHGNKKLDEAYQDAQHRKGCPVFLYFSVNGSGRFCGVAEMTGRVDFNNTMDFWERNRWCGSFPVKWHFVKDVPHCQLRRIILQNNENKPVTSSRDTQEVNFEQGLQMLNIIKNYSTTASILDNFSNFTGPQKVVPDVKVQQQSLESSADSKIAQECSVSAVLESSNALRACNGEAKTRENLLQGKLNQGKSQDFTVDKENARVPESV